MTKNDLNSDYTIPSTLIQFEHSEVDEKNEILLKVLRVSTICFTKDGDVDVSTTMRSTSKISSCRSISNPINTSSYGIGDSKGGHKVKFHAVKKGQEEIIVFESVRSLSYGKDKKVVFEEDEIMKMLFSSILVTEYHQFAGTRILAPTDRIRILLIFSSQLFPDKIETVQINSRGQTETLIARKELCRERNLWIIEFDNPKLGCGVYAYWIWPH